MAGVSGKVVPPSSGLKREDVIFYDDKKKKKYRMGRFLGKGGFAKCYELVDVETNEIFAGKIVPKSMLTKPHQKDKMAMEIDIHRSLQHKHVVQFYSFFEDKDNMFILLELCRRRSLMELHKRRKALTEPEVRFFMKQILLSVTYLHNQCVIHRDLKLGNLFLNDDLDIKLGDFGLATRVDFDGERKRTLCGTPNYIAPEVLAKKGHSYEVDVWSIGCILYTLLVGKPPFETSSLKDTYSRIKRNEYRIPSTISRDARNLIQKLLQSDPKHRPTTDNILTDPFFIGFIPAKLPISCLTVAPHFKRASSIGIAETAITHKPLTDVNAGDGFRKPFAEVNQGVVAIAQKPYLGDNPGPVVVNENPPDWHLNALLSQLNACIASKPTEKSPQYFDDAEDPAAIPIFWVSKWVDYSDKYGLGYQLCDSSVGVLFNDSTRLLLGEDGESMQYIDREGKEEFYGLSAYPDTLYKKVTLLKYFRSYMSEHLLKAGASVGDRPVEEGVRLPHLRTWFRTRSAIVLHLSNGILQINFFQDHTKVIFCPLMGAVSFIDENKAFRTFRLPLIEKHGCSKELASRIRYAKTMSERLLAKLDPNPNQEPQSNV